MEKSSIDKRSAGLTLMISLVMFVFMWFLNVWQAPDPPIPVYGLEMNFGTSKTGKGRRQPRPVVRKTKPVVKNETAQKPAPVEPVQKAQEEADVQAKEQAIKQKAESKTKVVTQDTETPVEVPKEKKEKPKPEVKKPVAEKKAVPPPPKPKAEGAEEAEDQPNKDKGHGDSGDTDKDKGVKDAKKNKEKPIILDKKTKGTGNGASAALDLTGWQWDETPRPDDQTEESGRIVFEISIDDQGYVISVRTLEKSISSKLEQVYRKAVENLTFSPSNDNNNPKALTKGRITFVIKSN
ncbi:MAG: energy transducer TonB [Cytophagales bacterium]|nr:energy transducer TonB [Cytophagales bacterium]